MQEEEINKEEERLAEKRSFEIAKEYNKKNPIKRRSDYHIMQEIITEKKEEQISLF